jgi:hypothetical protein
LITEQQSWQQGWFTRRLELNLTSYDKYDHLARIATSVDDA